MAAIEVEELTCRYGDTVAVDDVSLSVPDGELFGLLGPNGAGKSTLINTLCTLRRPTAGRARVAGHDVVSDRTGVRQSIGVVFQEPALDEELTGAENLAFHGRLYGMERARRRERTDAVLELVELDDVRDDPVGTYSGGMARRLELARGLLHRPDVLFLDEPTVGLDAGTRRTTREYIRRLNDEAGVTVVLTTHYMSEADDLCDRVAVMDRGSLVADDTPTSLKARLGGDHVHVGVDGPADAVAARLRRFEWVRTVAPADGVVDVVVDSGSRRVPALVTAAAEVAPITAVDVRRPTLEQVFLSLTGRSPEAAVDAGEQNGDHEPTAPSSAGTTDEATTDGGTE
jgi:ABC-2 type transport system ATP-binding protein